MQEKSVDNPANSSAPDVVFPIGIQSNNDRGIGAYNACYTTVNNL